MAIGGARQIHLLGHKHKKCERGAKLDVKQPGLLWPCRRAATSPERNNVGEGCLAGGGGEKTRRRRRTCSLAHQLLHPCGQARCGAQLSGIRCLDSICTPCRLGPCGAIIAGDAIERIVPIVWRHTVPSGPGNPSTHHAREGRQIWRGDDQHLPWHSLAHLMVLWLLMPSLLSEVFFTKPEWCFLAAVHRLVPSRAQTPPETACCCPQSKVEQASES